MKRFYSLVSIMLFVLTISFANINTVKAVENLEQENEITEEVIQKEDVEIQEKKEEIDLSLVNNRNEDEGKENEIQSTPGQVTGDKTAEVVTGDGEDGRSADVTIIVKGEEFDETSTEEREIVLVLDVSGSMNEEIERKTKIAALKESANELINSLLSEENIKIAENEAKATRIKAEAEAKSKAEEEAKKPVPVPEDIALLREIRDALKKN